MNPVEYDIKAYKTYEEKVRKIICTITDPNDTERLHTYITEYMVIQEKLTMLEDIYAEHIKIQD